MSISLQIIVTTLAAWQGCRGFPTTTFRYVFNEKELEAEKKLEAICNISTLYDTLYMLSRYNATTEDRLFMIERTVRTGRLGVDWVFRRIIVRFIPYIENATVQDRLHLLKLNKAFRAFAALPKTSGRFRAWHGRFTNLSRMVQHTNATYNAIGNHLVLVAHVRAYNVTFVYRNYELEVDDKRMEGAVTGGFDYIEFRMVNSWVTAPKCKLLYAFHSIYHTHGCYANVKRLGQYEYLNVELGVTICQLVEIYLKPSLDDLFALYWRKATDDTNCCRNVLFKEIFGVNVYLPQV